MNMITQRLQQNMLRRIHEYRADPVNDCSLSNRRAGSRPASGAPYVVGSSDDPWRDMRNPDPRQPARATRSARRAPGRAGTGDAVRQALDTALSGSHPLITWAHGRERGNRAAQARQLSGALDDTIREVYGS